MAKPADRGLGRDRGVSVCGRAVPIGRSRVLRSPDAVSRRENLDQPRDDLLQAKKALRD